MRIRVDSRGKIKIPKKIVDQIAKRGIVGVRPSLWGHDTNVRRSYLRVYPVDPTYIHTYTITPDGSVTVCNSWLKFIGKIGVRRPERKMYNVVVKSRSGKKYIEIT